MSYPSLPVKNVLAVVSGGLDSATMIWHLKTAGCTICEAITFDYGQRHRNETKHASMIVRRFSECFGVSTPHTISDISNVGSLIAKGALTGELDVPHEMYDSESQRVTIVPNRNMIFLSIAAGRAITIGAQHVAYAAHASDHAVYPDCRPEFIEQLDKALHLGNLYDPVGILAPFQRMTKAEIVKLGLTLGVAFEDTWSCYEGGERPCLQCGTCLERTEAFLENNTEDPSLTEREWNEAVRLYHQISRSSPNAAR